MTPPLDLDAIRRRSWRLTYCSACNGSGYVFGSRDGRCLRVACQECDGHGKRHVIEAEVAALIAEVERLRGLLANVQTAMPANRDTPPATAEGDEPRGRYQENPMFIPAKDVRVRRRNLKGPFTLVYEYQDGHDTRYVQTFAEAVIAMRKWKDPSNIFDFETCVLTIYDARGTFVEKSR